MELESFWKEKGNIYWVPWSRCFTCSLSLFFLSHHLSSRQSESSSLIPFTSFWAHNNLAHDLLLFWVLQLRKLWLRWVKSLPDATNEYGRTRIWIHICFSSGCSWGTFSQVTYTLDLLFWIGAEISKKWSQPLLFWEREHLLLSSLISQHCNKNTNDERKSIK